MDEIKARMAVVILTQTYKIEGNVAQFETARLTDFMQEARMFIAVTEATVFSHEGKKIVSVPFLNVHRDKIEVILPMGSDTAELEG